MGDCKQIEFKGRVDKCVYSSPDFKIYALNVSNQEYPYVKRNKYQNVSIIGNLSDLSEGVEYEVTATEENSKYGISYRVVNIRRNAPTDAEGTKAFLEEILTENQARVLYENYPNIIELVKNGDSYKVDLSKLYGIGEKTFASIKKKIIENFKLADLVGEFKNVISLSMLRKIYNKYPDINVLRDKLREKPYTTLTKISGCGFKTADAIVLELQEKNVFDFECDNIKEGKDRCLACVLYLLEQNEKEGNTCANLADIRKQCIEMAPSCARHFVDIVGDGAIYYNKEDMSIGLMETYDTERDIAETIVSNIKTNDVWNIDIEKYRNAGEFTLSDEQMCAVKNVCEYGISILNGGAGTGKSQSAFAIINMLKDNNKSFILMAPTGRASKVLAEYTHERASTIHRGLCYNPRLGWLYNKDNKLPYDVVIVDESSMIDVSLFGHLMDAIDFEHTRLVLIGDDAQLPSVGCGNLLCDFIGCDIVPTATLTKIFRYGEGGLMRVATDVRFCKPYLDKSMKGSVTQFGANKDYVFIDVEPDNIQNVAVSLYKKLFAAENNVKDIQILVAKNVGECGTVALNSMVQKAVNANYGGSRYMKIGDVVYYDGDLVMQNQNNYSARICDEGYRFVINDYNEEISTAFVANGETGIVKYSCSDYVVIDFDDILIRYDKDEMSSVKHAYVITTHKSQGSGIKNVILCTPKSDIFMINSNMLYVGITRTTKRCYHIGSLQTVNMAVKKKENLKRNTFMKNLLVETSKKNREQHQGAIGV